MSLVIDVAKLSKVYGTGENAVPALRGVSFQITSGEFVALMGPSGSGKSTLMHLLGCLDTATSGRYQLEKEDVGRLSNRRRAQIRNERIGFVFQTFNLLPRLSALENVAMPLRYRGRTNQVRERAAEALAGVGLAERLHHRPAELSGGQRQRVAIARALVTNPAIILADEPTGNLDSRTGADVMALLQRLNQDEGRTIILVTHDAQLAMYTQRVLRLHDGLLMVNGQLSTVNG
jgi:putative ABC transport system ATP-binding protein